MTGPYDDMMHMPHHVSERRVRMPRIDRAAQFAPFAALAGYDAAIRDAARRSILETELRNQGTAIEEDDIFDSDETM